MKAIEPSRAQAKVRLCMPCSSTSQTRPGSNIIQIQRTVAAAPASISAPMAPSRRTTIGPRISMKPISTATDTAQSPPMVLSEKPSVRQCTEL